MEEKNERLTFNVQRSTSKGERILGEGFRGKVSAVAQAMAGQAEFKAKKS